MSAANRQDVQQIATNRSSDIDYKDFMKLYKKCAASPYFFIVDDTTLLTDNPFYFRSYYLERI